MSDPRRLRELSDDAFGQGLLASARDERPQAGSRLAAAAALGIAAVAGDAAAASAGGGAGTASTAGVVTASKATALWLKVALGVALAGGGVAGYRALAPAALTPIAERGSVATSAPAPVAPASIATAVASIPAPSETVIEPLPLAEPAPPVTREPPAAPRRRPRSAASSAAPVTTDRVGDDLAGEIAVVDQARAALATGDLGAARTHVAAHRRTFRGGALAPEILAVAVEIEVRAGDRARASALLDELAHRFPSSASLRRARRVLDALD